MIVWEILLVLSFAVIIYIFALNMSKIDKSKIVVEKNDTKKEANNLEKKPFFRFDLSKIISKTKKEEAKKDVSKQEIEIQPSKKEGKNIGSFIGVFGGMFGEADKLFKDGKYDEAEKIYLKIATKDPKNIKVYNMLGAIYMERKNFTDAKEAFLAALGIDDMKSSTHYNYARACIELREFRNAKESLEKAIKLDKENEKYKKALQEVKRKMNIRFKELNRFED